MSGKEKIAVVLFNLGGPDSLKAVQPFLFNLFNDRAILNLPQPFRFFLAKLISIRRAPIAREIYKEIGGKSPLLENTKKQAAALEKVLCKAFNAKCFIAMRYWHPFSRETAENVHKFNPDKIVLLPLYPQFSTTTSASSLAEWKKITREISFNYNETVICCFPCEENFIEAHIKTIEPVLKRLSSKGPARILFTAHGLPKKIIANGDPYAWQVEKTVSKIVKRIKTKKNWDYVICYQSRVGPLKWLGPSTEDEIIRAGLDSRNLVVVPVSFISEHSETLVELDIEYAALAKNHKIEHYERVPALGTQDLFIKSLAQAVKEALIKGGVLTVGGKGICPTNFSKCLCRGK